MIEATLTGDAQVAARFAALPDKARKAISDEMRRQWFLIQTAVVREKLSGDPLHRRTGNLASSINVGGADSATAFEESDTEIVGRIGTRVKYGRVHEDGGTFQVPSHERTITQVFGRSITPRTITVREHTVTFPQRSFLRSTLREMGPGVTAALEKALADAVKE